MTDVDWQNRFKQQGYALFPGLVPKVRIAAALEAIEDSLRTRYEPARQTEYDHQSYCPELRDSAAIVELLRCTPASEFVREALGDNVTGMDHAQIAIRQPHNHHEACPPLHHLDGFPTPFNGVCAGRIDPFTALVGIYLTATTQPFAGNFVAWPATHRMHSAYFQARGPQAMYEGLPNLEVGEPTQLMVQPGDVVLCHYLLGHAAAVNTSDNARIAIYFRLGWPQDDAEAWALLTSLWGGWRI